MSAPRPVRLISLTLAPAMTNNDNWLGATKAGREAVWQPSHDEAALSPRLDR
jgi:hypothetical protein